MMSQSLSGTENVALLNLPTFYPSLTGTANPATDTITLSSGTVPPDGTRVLLNAPGFLFATAPGGTSDGVIYFVKNDSSTDMRLATSLTNLQNFNFIDITSAGSGWNLVVQAPGEGSVADAVQYELPSGNGYARFTGTQGSVSVLATTAETTGYLASFALASGVTFNAILTMINGGSNIGDNYGELAHIEILAAPVTTSGSPYARYIKVIGSAI
jgi:hypothetical protein